MQKILFGIFAHPDDEAFVAAGTLLKEVRSGTELHLITLTAGENGMNPDDVPDLGEVRLQEWHAAGKLLGATTMNHLGYTDGTLNNIDQQEIAYRIEEIVNQSVQAREDIEIEFMCLDLNGLTGHIDHIVASRSACLAFYRLKGAGQPLTRIRLACMTHEDYPTADTGFVFMEPGRTAAEIDETVDASDLLEQIKEVMYAHRSQRADCEYNLNKHGDRIAINHFIVKD